MAKRNASPAPHTPVCPSWCATDHAAHGARLWCHQRTREVTTFTGAKVYVDSVARDGNSSYITITSKDTGGRFTADDARAIADALDMSANDIDRWDDAQAEHTPWDTTTNCGFGV